jgi:hypothetical protein
MRYNKQGKVIVIEPTDAIYAPIRDHLVPNNASQKNKNLTPFNFPETKLEETISHLCKKKQYNTAYLMDVAQLLYFQLERDGDNELSFYETSLDDMKNNLADENQFGSSSPELPYDGKNPADVLKMLYVASIDVVLKRGEKVERMYEQQRQPLMI